MSLELFKKVSSEYYELLGEGDPDFSFSSLPFDFTVQSNHLLWSRHEKEYTRSIINLFNSFSSCLYRLHLLEKIIFEHDCNEQENLDLRLEFLQIPLHFCLTKPYEFSGRIKYCCIVLCHHANRITFNANNDLKEKSYNFNVLENLLEPWDAGDKLKEALDLVGNRNSSFTEATDKYRDSSQHQQPRNLEIGLVSTARENIVNSRDLPEELKRLIAVPPEQPLVEIDFIIKHALKTRDMIPSLLEQGEYMRDLFHEYYNLVREQNLKINHKISQDNTV